MTTMAILVGALLVGGPPNPAAPPAAGAPAPRRVEPSPEYLAGLRRTVELRKQRRRARDIPPVGTIVPFPMPPSLIIRQTSEVHGEIEDLLFLLRYR